MIRVKHHGKGFDHRQRHIISNTVNHGHTKLHEGREYLERMAQRWGGWWYLYEAYIEVDGEVRVYYPVFGESARRHVEDFADWNMMQARNAYRDAPWPVNVKQGVET